MFVVAAWLGLESGVGVVSRFYEAERQTLWQDVLKLEPEPESDFEGGSDSKAWLQSESGNGVAVYRGWTAELDEELGVEAPTVFEALVC